MKTKIKGSHSQENTKSSSQNNGDSTRPTDDTVTNTNGSHSSGSGTQQSPDKNQVPNLATNGKKKNDNTDPICLDSDGE